MKNEILIVPCHGEVKMSQGFNTVTVAFNSLERNKKLKGYTLMGEDWRIESEPAPLTLTDNGWDWLTCIEGRIDTGIVSEEEVNVLCYFLRKSNVQYLVLMENGRGRNRFMLYSDAKVDFNFGRTKIQFIGLAPYNVTYLDCEVELTGKAVDLADRCISNGLWQTQGWEYNQ